MTKEHLVGQSMGIEYDMQAAPIDDISEDLTVVDLNLSRHTDDLEQSCTSFYCIFVVLRTELFV